MRYLYKFVKFKYYTYIYINIIGLYEHITLICNTTDFKHGFIQKTKNML